MRRQSVLDAAQSAMAYCMQPRFSFLLGPRFADPYDFAPHRLQRPIHLILPLAACGNKHSLSRFLILNDVLASLQLCECSDALSCVFEGLRFLYEMQASVASHLEDAKWQRHQNSRWKRPIRRDSSAIIASIWCVGSCFANSMRTENSSIPCRDGCPPRQN
jgi:hypothetical protein